MNTEEFLVSRGYVRLNTSVPAVSVMYRIAENTVYCLLILNTVYTGFSVPQFDHIKEQVQNSFKNKGYPDVRILTLILSGRNNSFREITTADCNSWVMDGSSGRVILFENSVSDFDDLKSGLEASWTRDFTEGAVRAYADAMKQAERSRKDTSVFGVIRSYFEKNEATVALVLLNIIVFIGLSIFGSTTDASYMARHGALYSSYLVTNNEFYRLFTSMFMHFGFIHLATNMLALLLIGGQVEDILGKPKYLILYLVSGIFACFVSFVTSFLTNSGVVSAGASGAIFALIGALFAIVIKNKGKYKDLTVSRIAFLVAYSLYAGFTGKGVDNAAHIGGLLIGLIITAIIYRPTKADRENHFNQAI